MRGSMWIRMSNGDLTNTSFIRRIYAEEEDGIFTVTAAMNDGDYEALRECSSMESARANVDYIHKCLSEGVSVCNLYSTSFE